LLSEAGDDDVGADNPVQFIDAFADELDLATAVCPGRGDGDGPPRLCAGRSLEALHLRLFEPGAVRVGAWIRRLEMESRRNSEVIWLLRSLKPDVKTLADFRRDNRRAFRSVFCAFVLLCRQLDLFGRALLAVDGIRRKAVNNKDRNFTRLQNFIRAADERLDDDLRRLDDEGDVEEGGAARVRKISPRRSRRSARSATATG
jgi:transposase